MQQKSILIEQFNKKVIKSKGYRDIFKKFMVINYTEKTERLVFSDKFSKNLGKPL